MENEKHFDNIEIALQAINNPVIRNSEEFRDWIKNEGNLQLYEELVLYRTAMLEQSGSEISIDFAWEKFIAGKQKTRRNLLRPLSIAISVAAAITILFFALRNESEQHMNADLLIIPEFIANNEPQEITLEADNQLPVAIVSKPKQQIKSIEKPTVKSTTANKIEDVILAKGEDTQVYKISIPRGKNYYMMLEDSTEVWLNADSKLSFPSRFEADKREVELVGEGYFKVKPDASRPFIVKSGYLITKVLGTEFNFRAYNKKDAEVTLVSGKVAVSGVGNDNTKEVILSPNETVSMINGKFQVSETDIKKYTSWVEGWFYFDNETLEDIMKELGRWYNVNIYFQDISARNYKFKFWADRDYSFQEAVDMLNQIGKVSIETYGNNVIIKEN